jgi:ankyrin repeat protein
MGRSPLMQASIWGKTDVVRRLLQAGADKALKDNVSECDE